MTNAMLGLIAGVVLAPAPRTGNVIFVHPDGTGLNTWNAFRALEVGPDSKLNYDHLEHMGIYVGLVRNSITPSSNSGAVSHAYGVRPNKDSFGLENGKPFRSLSGRPLTVMMEAEQAGMAVGVVNSAGVGDAGTGAFLAQTRSRREYTEIVRQMLARKPEVMLGGGEAYFLPKGTQGRFGEGMRTDGRNLIQEARKAGYAVVFTRDELKRLPANTKHVLGLFAHEDTFNDKSEEELLKTGTPMYVPTAPTVAEMTTAALRVFKANNKQFMLVVEEEATDNFGGENNAMGVFEALRRADRALGVAREFVKKNPNTLLITAADSDCGGLQLSGDVPEELEAGKPVPPADENGSPIDGVRGTGTAPFFSRPDRAGRRHRFFVQWASSGDMSGGALVRATGMNAHLVRGNVANTDIYRIMFRTLFGRDPEPKGTRR